MGVAQTFPTQFPLAVAYLLTLLIGWSQCQDGACLQDGKHKATPSPEPYLRDCTLYAENACCSENDIQVPTASSGRLVQDLFWDGCGPVSQGCRAFLKRVACFHLCSPDIARWPHPRLPGSFQGVPLCHSFCRDWFDACKVDRMCSGDEGWLSQRNNCTGDCVTYQQMYQDGRGLCGHIGAGSFTPVEDDDREEENSPSCGCLTLSPTDREVIAALRAQQENPDELDTTKAGLPQYRAPCPMRERHRGTTPPPRARRDGKNAAVSKRSVFVEDVEGSGSGF
ncbi:retbindin [Paramormyrops kingsleyae]|uniref:Retbindin n=1 Tax=Paramormyrops kingsleyae TaxID=1676925 RepID=A0A3B3SB10_9TELE|nr:riboflavin-binding protein-like [Paramormyrops kingsleyae]